MDSRLSSLWRLLTHPRPVALLDRFEARLKALFTPGDWVIAGVCALLMAGGVVVMVASVSSLLSIEVPMRGGTHTEGVVGTPRFINPVLAVSDTDQDLVSLVFAGLMQTLPDGTLAPALADHYQISDDGKTYTFHIAPSATFQDGTPVTANDVIFTVKMAQKPDVKSPRRASWEGVDVTKGDDHTVIFTLKSPYAPFLSNTTLGILPEHLWRGISPEEFPFSNLNIHPIGAGPFALEKVTLNKSGVPVEVRLISFSNARPEPYIKNMVVRFFPDVEAVSAALTSGTIDAAYGVAAHDFPQKNRVEAPYARIFAVFMNQNQNPIFADAKVRAALDMAVDKKRIVDTVLNGYGSVLTGPLPPERAVKNTVSAVDRLATARAILAADGWTLASTTGTTTDTRSMLVKKTKKQTTTLAFTLTTANVPELKAAAQAVADDWRSLGAEVKVEFFDQGDLATDVIRPRKYDALLFGEVVGREPDLYAFWHSSQRNDPGLNVALYTNAAVDKLLEKARAEIDPAVRAAETAEAAAKISAETAAIFLYAPHLTYVTEPKLHGVTLSQAGSPSDRFAGVQSWYLQTERVWPIFAE